MLTNRYVALNIQKQNNLENKMQNIELSNHTDNLTCFITQSIGMFIFCSNYDIC